MTTKFRLAMAIAAAWSAPLAAQAGALTVVKVAAPAINCVFDASCTVTVNDSTGNLDFSALGKNAFLQSRTFTAVAGTPGAGTTAYLYRVDIRTAEKATECLAGLVLNVGPVKSLTYPPNQPGHVFVVTQGGLGDIGIKSADQDGDVVTFTFDGFLCAGHTSFFFGLAAAGAPHTVQALLYGFGEPAFVQVAARAPQHIASAIVAPLPPSNLRIPP